MRSAPSNLRQSPIATRYEKTANSFTGVLCLAALDWIKR